MNKFWLIFKRTTKFCSRTFLRKKGSTWKEFVSGLKTDLSRIDMYNSVLHHYHNNPQYKEELLYLKRHKMFHVFPYERCRTLPDPPTGFDTSCNLPYVLHNNKKLYFPDDWTRQQVLGYYTTAVSVENILEIDEGYLTKTPHKYQSPNHIVEEGDALIDAGSAEGLFTLNVIDWVSHATIIECDKRWEQPLRQTFKPYMDKVDFVFKMLGDKDCENMISLPTLLKRTHSAIFLKMDIEGAEVNTLEPSIPLLEHHNHTIKISCCTYHNNSDFDKLYTLLSPQASSIEYSDGYMLIFDYNEKRPFFRHGMIRATISPRTNAK